MTPPTVTPAWLLDSEVGLCPCGCIGKRSKKGFIEKTIGGGAGVLHRTMFSDDIASSTGLLQGVEPRVKLVTLLALLVVTALVHNIPVLIALYGLTLALAAASGLALGFFVRRVWLFVPIFTGVVVLPAMFSFITPGEIVVPLGTWFGHPVGLTHQGMTAAVLIVSRVAVSISFVVLLTLTTKWNRLLASLRALGVPAMFVMVLTMAYRYLFHLLNSVIDMYTARKARMVATDVGVESGRKMVAASAGALFGKAHALSEEVHMSMVARGYTGNVRSLEQQPVGSFDIVWAAACVLVALLALGGDLVIGR
jgi:cobalt/nickel transport system permease protein